MPTDDPDWPTAWTRAALELSALALVCAHGPTHGYDVAKRLQAAGLGTGRPSLLLIVPGTAVLVGVPTGFSPYRGADDARRVFDHRGVGVHRRADLSGVPGWTTAPPGHRRPVDVGFASGGAYAAGVLAPAGVRPYRRIDSHRLARRPQAPPAWQDRLALA
jgi:hypothetical protein